MVEASKIVYPLSFIDAVNKKQLDLETGFFRDPNSGKYHKKCKYSTYEKISSYSNRFDLGIIFSLSVLCKFSGCF